MKLWQKFYYFNVIADSMQLNITITFSFGSSEATYPTVGGLAFSTLQLNQGLQYYARLESLQTIAQNVD